MERINRIEKKNRKKYARHSYKKKLKKKTME
jgi:hypothetical protein